MKSQCLYLLWFAIKKSMFVLTVVCHEKGMFVLTVVCNEKGNVCTYFALP